MCVLCRSVCIKVRLGCAINLLISSFHIIIRSFSSLQRTNQPTTYYASIDTAQHNKTNQQQGTCPQFATTTKQPPSGTSSPTWKSKAARIPSSPGPTTPTPTPMKTPPPLTNKSLPTRGSADPGAPLSVALSPTAADTGPRTTKVLPRLPRLPHKATTKCRLRLRGTRRRVVIPREGRLSLAAHHRRSLRKANNPTPTVTAMVKATAPATIAAPVSAPAVAAVDAAEQEDLGAAAAVTLLSSASADPGA